MRFKAYVLIFSLLFNSLAFALDFDTAFEKVSKFGSVEITAKKLCIKGSDKTSTFEKNYTDICKVVRENEICKQVDEDEKLICDDVNENTMDVFSFRFIYNCAKGLWNSLVNLFEFIVGFIKGTLGYAFDSEQRDKVNEAMGEYYDSIKNYLAVEFDKRREKSDSDLAAITSLAGDLLKTGFQAIGRVIEETYYNLGCYHQAARQERVCELVGDIVMPPVAALGLIFKGPKMLKKVRSIVDRKIEQKKGVKRDTLELVNDNHPVLLRPGRDLTSQEMTSSNVKSLTRKMITTMKVNGGIGLAAPQVGQGLKLIVYKNSHGEPVVMGNPVIKSHGSESHSLTEGCLSLKGVACSVERPKEITVEYLDESGELQTKNFSGKEATVIQHETDHINGILFPFKSESYAKKFGVKHSKSLSPNGRESLGRFLHGLSKEEINKLKNKFASELDGDIKGIDDPNSLVFSLKDVDGISSSDDAFNEILNFYAIGVKTSKSSEKFKKYNNWVKSKAHALYLYDKLSSLGHKENSDLFRYLLSKNEFFKKAKPIRGPPHTLITYSFEKESSVKDITLWFKKAGMDDEEWLNLSDDERLEILKKATNVKKDKVSDTRIASTGLKPSYIGNYSEELGHSLFDKSYGWEVANKRYEIDLDRTMEQVRDTAKFTGENHSFHTHVVFDMPKNYKHFDKFQLWSKQTNDYLYIKGMEEGLHGNYLTGVAYLPGEAPPRAKMGVGNTLPTNPSEVKLQSHKFFSMGIRGDIYGDSPIEGHKKIGLELRDTTRNMDQLDNHMKEISNSVSGYRWENLPDGLDRSDFTFLTNSPHNLETALKDEVSSSFLTRLKKSDARAGIALVKFEDGNYMNFKTGKLTEASPEHKKRIIEAREYFISELKKIDREVQEMVKNGDSFEKEDIDMAINMTLSEWAKKARVSSLYEGI